MKTVDIKGKAYVEVSERIMYFRNTVPDGKIITKMISNENGVCIFMAEIFNDTGLVATGHAYEKEGSTFINKTSYIENCETSAVGRALGIFGIGIDTSVASAEEVGNAIKQQKDKPKKKEQSKQVEPADGDVKGWLHTIRKEIEQGANWLDCLKAHKDDIVKEVGTDGATEIYKAIEKEVTT